VALLAVALGALVLGCLFLLLVLNRYGFSSKVSSAARPVPSIAATILEKNPSVRL
jgi:hypothetical protein